jgi:4-amino-4-deoxy-L-arabinose transferase-like glycosyltransferase
MALGQSVQTVSRLPTESAPGTAALDIPARWSRALAAIVAVALLLRVLVLVTHGLALDNGDEPQYYALGKVLADGGEFRQANIGPMYSGGKNGDITAHRSPVMPALIAAARLLSTHDLLYLRILMVALSTCTCLLLGVAARAAGFPGAGLVAAGAWALWPSALIGWYSAERLAPEGLSAFLLAAHLWLLITALRERSLGRAALAGLSIGLAVLTRGYLAFALPFVALFILFWKGDRRLVLAVTFSVAAALPVGGWMIRNWVRLGSPVLSTQTEAFYLGNNAWARGSFDGEILKAGEKSVQLAPLARRYPDFWTMSELERSRVWTIEAKRSIRDNPRRAVWLAFRKSAIFWGPFQAWGVTGYHHHWAWLLMLLLTPLGIVALRAERRLDAAWIAVLPVLATYLAVLLTYAQDRYRYPIEPLIAFTGAIGAAALVRRWRARKARQAGPETVRS